MMMKNIIPHIFCLLALLLSASTVRGSDNLRALNVTDGLSDLTVRVIYKDSLGYVWLGTANTVDRFDGAHFMHYSIPGANENQKLVNAIAEMPRNEIWMGNNMGLWRVDKVERKLERISAEDISYSVNCLLHDGLGTLYIGTKRGLYVYHSGNIKRILLDTNVLSAANDISAISFGEDGLLWIATGMGLLSMKVSDEAVTPYHNISHGHHNCSFRCIARIGKKLYLGTNEHGVICFDTSTKKFEDFISVGCNVISTLSSDGERTLYVGTDGGGASFVDTEEKRIVRTYKHASDDPESLLSNSVYSLLVDRDGLMWVGFYQSGLQYTIWQDKLFTVYSYPPYFHSKDMPVRSLFIRGGEKLIGTRDGLFFIDEERHIYREFHSPQLRSNMIFCCQYYRGNYYIGTYGGGMYILDPLTLTVRDFCPEGDMPFSHGHIFCFEIDQECNLWIGTSSGVFCYDGRNIRHHFTSANSKLPDGNVYEIFFDSTRKGWICTEGGVCILNPVNKTLRTDIFPEGFIHNEKVRVIFEDSSHKLYFLPDKGAMLVSDLSMTTFRRLPPGTPLDGHDGVFIAEDKRHWLWIGTTNGLYHYDKVSSFTPYGFADGLPSGTFTFCPPADDGEGGLWLGNSRGLLHLAAEHIDNEKQKHGDYRVSVTDVMVNGKSTVFPEAYKTGIKLKPTQKNVTFCFSDFSYTLPTYMHFEYKLDGIDKDWMTLSGTAEMTYYDLPSGKYTFHVRRMGDIISESEMKIIMSKSFDWSFLTLVLAAMLALFAAYKSWKHRHYAVPLPQQAASASVTMMSDASLPASETEELTAGADAPKYKSVNLSEEDCDRLAARLEEVMRKERLYTNPNLKIADLASAVNVSAHTLSYLFNQHLGSSYYDYINGHRVEEFKRLVASDDNSRYTLTALAENCGFSSRASFFRYFKKSEGITPSEYLRKIGKSES